MYMFFSISSLDQTCMNNLYALLPLVFWTILYDTFDKRPRLKNIDYSS